MLNASIYNAGAKGECWERSSSGFDGFPRRKAFIRSKVALSMINC
jgi:hypothetical protein